MANLQTIFFRKVISWELLPRILYRGTHPPSPVGEAHDFRTKNLLPHARAKDWEPFTVPEMKKFIGHWILTGLDEKLAIIDCSSNHLCVEIQASSRQ